MHTNLGQSARLHARASVETKSAEIHNSNDVSSGPNQLKGFQASQETCDAFELSLSGRAVA